MKQLKRKINVVVEKTKTGYSAFAEDIPVFTTAKGITALHRNLLEALNLYYENSGYEVKADNIRLKLDMKQFFKYYKVLNANFLASRIGINPTLLSQYVNGKKQPSARQTDKIIQGIQQIGRELAALQFKS